MDSALIVKSFELAAERCEDLTPLVYARLFRDYPDLERHFWREPRLQIQGEMLAKVIESILDFVGERRYSAVLIGSESVTHAGYDVPPDAFALFFGVVADCLREVVGDAWTGDMDAAWRELLVELDAYVEGRE